MTNNNFNYITTDKIRNNKEKRFQAHSDDNSKYKLIKQIYKQTKTEGNGIQTATNSMNNINESHQKLIMELGLTGLFLQWMNNHKIISNFILLLEIAILIWTIVTYNFTTKI